MAIGNCDCCDARNVPGSVINCPGEPFACYLCQADPDSDPYREIEVDCAVCDGAGCHECDRTGKLTIETEPVTLDDHRAINAAIAAIRAAVEGSSLLIFIVSLPVILGLITGKI